MTGSISNIPFVRQTSRMVSKRSASMITSAAMRCFEISSMDETLNWVYIQTALMRRNKYGLMKRNRCLGWHTFEVDIMILPHVADVKVAPDLCVRVLFISEVLVV